MLRDWGPLNVPRWWLVLPPVIAFVALVGSLAADHLGFSLHNNPSPLRIATGATTLVLIFVMAFVEIGAAVVALVALWHLPSTRTKGNFVALAFGILAMSAAAALFDIYMPWPRGLRHG